MEGISAAVTSFVGTRMSVEFLEEVGVVPMKEMKGKHGFSLLNSYEILQ